MAQAASFTRLLNPWLLHLQKMGLELRCLLCLNLLDRPLLLPCDHVFCSSCITKSVEGGSHCPFCKTHCDDRDIRQVTVLENIVSIYRSLDAAFAQCVSQANMPDFVNQFEVLATPHGDHRQSKGTLGGPGQASPSTGVIQPNGGQRNENQIQETDLNQTSTGSPPSLAEMKDSDEDDSDQGFQHSATRLLVKGIGKRELKDIKDYGRPLSLGKEDSVIGMKRQKLDLGLEKVVVNGDVHDHSMFLNAQYASTSNSEAATQLRRPSFHAHTCGASDASDSNSTVICAFCQSSKLSEASGPMLHYLNGKPVEGDALNQPNVLHVHSNCIEWAPQVYYDGETVVNLEVELARGAKLKCNSCGLKGAALGCYAKSCRKTFHAPCAVHILGCRWDSENFLMLCPTHSSLKFPKERSKSSNSGKDHSPIHSIASQQFNKTFTSSKWVLCGSALSSAQKNMLTQFARITDATVSKTWKPNVTHVIAATDGNGACSRTLKVLMAILHGRWVLNIEWIRACMEAMHPLGEEPYEIDLDVHGCFNGPKRGRLRIMEKAPKLFSGLNFYFCGGFVPSYKGYLEDLVLAAGGTLLEKDMLMPQQSTNAESSTTSVVIYSLDPPLEGESEDTFSVQCRRVEAGDLAAQTGSSVVGHTWILESIAACELQPFA